MEPILETKWHTLEVPEIFKILKSGEHGLSTLEAKERIERDGLNALPAAKRESVFLIFLRQFKSPLIYILLAASAAVFLLGEEVDSIVIAAVLFINAAIGSIQEGRARNTLLALNKFVETRTVVVRDAEEAILPDTRIVAGDVIILETGDKVPADVRIITARNLKIDESALTGESTPAHKTSAVIKNPNLPVTEEYNMAFKGTHVVAGNGRAIVVKTGTETYIGKIAKEIAAIDTEIPLRANIRYLSRLIILITFVLGVLIFIFGIMTGKSPLEMLATVISISVSVIPEGLPVAITIILATGVWRMSKRNALVKRLQAVEALGQARIIAVDKTGTITKNEMTVAEVYVEGKTFEVGGVGYEPKGEVKFDNRMINPPNHPELLLIGKIASLGADARLMFSRKEKGWRISGDPTEAAVLVLAEKLGFKKNDLEQEYPFVSEFPFNYESKYRATVHKVEGKNFLTVIGAPEIVLSLCNRIWYENGEEKLHEEDKEGLTEEYSKILKKGLRVLALAMNDDASENLSQDMIKDLTFVGFVGMKDALRPEVKEATKRAILAGVRVIMITGDHRITAEAIAKEAYILRTGDHSLTGTEIEKLSDEELVQKLDKTAVFARVTPEHKSRIINAYKSRGDIIAMTGDGVNDAPSLVTADLGVAMGKIGTEVAKEASDIILLDDNFGSIISAIEEGRSIYKTIRKVLLYLFSTSIGELLTIIGAIVAGFPLPLLPAQIIWLNFVTDGFFTVALAMEPRERGLLQSNFEKPKKYLVDTFMSFRMLIMALPMMLVTLVLFHGYFEMNLAKAWTITLTILAVFQWFNAWNCRSQKESLFTTNLLENKYMVGATFTALFFQLLAIYAPPFQKFLHTVPLSLWEWFMIISLATTIILVEEIRKFFFRRKLPPVLVLKPTLQTH